MLRFRSLGFTVSILIGSWICEGPARAASPGFNVLGPPPQASPAPLSDDGEVRPPGHPRPVMSSRITDDPLQDLLEDQRKQAVAYSGLNAVNPLSADFKASAGLPKIFAAPVTQFGIKLATNSEFMPLAEKMINHPNLRKFGYWQGGIFVVFILIRLWRSSKLTGIFARLWFGTWSLAVYAAISAWVLPSVMFGDVYPKLLKFTYEAARDTWREKREGAGSSVHASANPAPGAIDPSPVPFVQTTQVAPPMAAPADPIKGVSPQAVNQMLQGLRAQPAPNSKR